MLDVEKSRPHPHLIQEVQLSVFTFLFSALCRFMSAGALLFTLLELEELLMGGFFQKYSPLLKFQFFVSSKRSHGVPRAAFSCRNVTAFRLANVAEG